LRGLHKQALEERRFALAEDGFEMAEGLRMLAKKKMAMLAEDEAALARVSLKDIVLPWAIAQDKGLGALGENKTVVEHRVIKASLEDAKQAIEEAQAAMRKGAIDVVVKDVTETAEQGDE
jgi:hypothetical protein